MAVNSANVVLSFVPRFPYATVMMAMGTHAAMRPYSIADMPRFCRPISLNRPLNRPRKDLGGHVDQRAEIDTLTAVCRSIAAFSHWP